MWTLRHTCPMAAMHAAGVARPGSAEEGGLRWLTNVRLPHRQVLPNLLFWLQLSGGATCAEATSLAEKIMYK